MNFEDFAQYLSDPLTLAGFIIFVAVGLLKFLIDSGSVPSLSKKSAENLTHKIVKYGFATALLVIILSFALNFAKLYKEVSTKENALIPEEEIIPFNVGWVLVGFFNENSQDYLEGSYAEIIHRPDISQSELKTPVIGDILRVKKDRNIIIADYQKKGLTHQFKSILDDSVLEEGEKVKILDDDDYTGIIIPKNTLIITDDVSIGTRGEKGSQAVWILARQCHVDIDTCIAAKDKIEQQK